MAHQIIKCAGFFPGQASLAYFFFLGPSESSKMSGETVHAGWTEDEEGVGNSQTSGFSTGGAKKILQKNLLGRIQVHVHTGNYPAIKNRREGERRRRRGECPIGIKLRGGWVRIGRRTKRLSKWTLLHWSRSHGEAWITTTIIITWTLLVKEKKIQIVCMYNFKNFVHENIKSP